MTDAWQGYTNVCQLDNGIYDYAVICSCIDAVSQEIDAETIEGSWIQVKCKIHCQGSISSGLFAGDLAVPHWHTS